MYMCVCVCVCVCVSDIGVPQNLSICLKFSRKPIEIGNSLE